MLPISTGKNSRRYRRIASKMYHWMRITVRRWPVSHWLDLVGPTWEMLAIVGVGGVCYHPRGQKL